MTYVVSQRIYCQRELCISTLTPVTTNNRLQEEEPKSYLSKEHYNKNLGIYQSHRKEENEPGLTHREVDLLSVNRRF